MLKKFYYNLPKFLQSYIDKSASKISNNLEEEFIYSDIGKKYNLVEKDKIKIIDRIKKSLKKIESATSISVHLELAKKILALDNNEKGSIVECGCFKGASSVSLSIFAKITDRKLIIYDSFEGLPEDNDGIKGRDYPFLKLTEKYKKGMYAGTLEEVKNNLKFYGELDVCIFRQGYFNNTLDQHNEMIDFLFLDVDLIKSTEDCIKNLWKFIKDNSFIYTDDACDIDVVKFWFNNDWWMKNLNCAAPGYIGSGCGIPIGGKYSSLGFAIKNSSLEQYNKAYFLN